MREIYYQNSTARYVSSKRGCRGRREHSVNAVLGGTQTEEYQLTWSQPGQPNLG